MKENTPYALRFAVCCFLFCSCSRNYSPKPAGYYNIEFAEHVYRPSSGFSRFEFNVSAQAEVKEISRSAMRETSVPPKNTQGEEWFNIIYPALNARIYCSYIPVAKNNLAQLSEESRRLVYLQHAAKADAIRGQSFENPEQNVYGLIYEVKGNVASPIQFVLTDSVKSFFRGALYFDGPPNQDSIAPVLNYINEDIHVLIDSFKWKK